MPEKLVEKREEFAAKSKVLKGFWDEAGDQLDVSLIKSINGLAADDTVARVAFMQASNSEIDALGVEIEGLVEIENMKNASDLREKGLMTPTSRHQQPPTDDDRKGEEKSIGRLFVESPAYKQFFDSPMRSPGDVNIKSAHDMDLKTIFRTANGWSSEQVRLDRVELDPQRPVAVIDRIPQIPTGSETIRYMEETTFTNNAVETAEATSVAATDLIGEAALVLTERTQAVEWLPVFIPVTMQQLEDVEAIEEYINQRLTFMLRQRLDSQILVGDGATPNLLGTNNVSGINTQAKGADPTTDAIYKAMDKIRTVGFTEPTRYSSIPWTGRTSDCSGRRTVSISWVRRPTPVRKDSGVCRSFRPRPRPRIRPSWATIETSLTCTRREGSP